MGMQHLPTTFFETAERLKRRQMLDFFASPAMTARTRLQPRLEFGCSRLSLALGAAGTGLFLRR